MDVGRPIGRDARVRADQLTPAAITSLGVLRGSATVTAGTNGASLRSARMYGSLIVGSTAGTLQLKWAQNTSSGTATTCTHSRT